MYKKTANLKETSVKHRLGRITKKKSKNNNLDNTINLVNIYLFEKEPKQFNDNYEHHRILKNEKKARKDKLIYPIYIYSFHTSYSENDNILKIYHIWDNLKNSSFFFRTFEEDTTIFRKLGTKKLKSDDINKVLNYAKFIVYLLLFDKKGKHNHLTNLSLTNNAIFYMVASE
jgi:hypothetical protein